MPARPKAVIFDLDNTLAEPYQAPSRDMCGRLDRLLECLPVAIMSAASLDRMRQTVLQGLPAERFSNLHLLTANAAQAYSWDGSAWINEYRFDFDGSERNDIEAALQDAARKTGVLDSPRTYGPQFVEYEGYVAFTALGTGAPPEERKTWDPDQKKRRAMKALLDVSLPKYDVLIGGSTTIDKTPKGINKAYGVRWLAEKLGCKAADMLYVGDALYEGGNDAVVIPTGIQTHQVTGPADSETLIDDLLARCNNTL